MSALPPAVHEQLLLSCDYRDVALARQFTAGMLDRTGFPRPYDPVMLVVSELVSNVLRHGGGEGRLFLSGTADRLRIEVADQHPCTEADMLRGWGLTLVDMLSDRWGVAPRTDGTEGKVVWCEMSADGHMQHDGERGKLQYDHGAIHAAEAAH